jgi:hypothetical protein
MSTDTTPESVSEKLDRLLALMGEEVNLHPDFVSPPAGYQVQGVPVTYNCSVPLVAQWWVQDHEGGRYLHLRLRDGNGMYVIDRAWKCVYRDPMTGAVVDRPGTAL